MTLWIRRQFMALSALIVTLCIVACAKAADDDYGLFVDPETAFALPAFQFELATPKDPDLLMCLWQGSLDSAFPTKLARTKPHRMSTPTKVVCVYVDDVTQEWRNNDYAEIVTVRLTDYDGSLIAIPVDWGYLRLASDKKVLAAANGFVGRLDGGEKRKRCNKPESEKFSWTFQPATAFKELPSGNRWYDSLSQGNLPEDAVDKARNAMDTKSMSDKDKEFCGSEDVGKAMKDILTDFVAKTGLSQNLAASLEMCFLSQCIKKEFTRAACGAFLREASKVGMYDFDVPPNAGQLHVGITKLVTGERIIYESTPGASAATDLEASKAQWKEGFKKKLSRLSGSLQEWLGVGNSQVTSTAHWRACIIESEHCLDKHPLYKAFAPLFLSKNPGDDPPTLLFNSRNPLPIWELFHEGYAMSLSGEVTVWVDGVTVRGDPLPFSYDILDPDATSGMRALLLYNTKVTGINVRIIVDPSGPDLASMCSRFINPLEKMLRMWSYVGCYTRKAFPTLSCVVGELQQVTDSVPRWTQLTQYSRVFIGNGDQKIAQKECKEWFFQRLIALGKGEPTDNTDCLSAPKKMPLISWSINGIGRLRRAGDWTPTWHTLINMVRQSNIVALQGVDGVAAVKDLVAAINYRASDGGVTSGTGGTITKNPKENQERSTYSACVSGDGKLAFIFRADRGFFRIQNSIAYDDYACAHSCKSFDDFVKAKYPNNNNYQDYVNEYGVVKGLVCRFELNPLPSDNFFEAMSREFYIANMDSVQSKSMGQLQNIVDSAHTVLKFALTSSSSDADPSKNPSSSLYQKQFSSNANSKVDYKASLSVDFKTTLARGLFAGTFSFEPTIFQSAYADATKGVNSTLVPPFRQLQKVLFSREGWTGLGRGGLFSADRALAATIVDGARGNNALYRDFAPALTGTNLLEPAPKYCDYIYSLKRPARSAITFGGRDLVVGTWDLGSFDDKRAIALRDIRANDPFRAIIAEFDLLAVQSLNVKGLPASPQDTTPYKKLLDLFTPESYARTERLAFATGEATFADIFKRIENRAPAQWATVRPKLLTQLAGASADGLFLFYNPAIFQDVVCHSVEYLPRDSDGLPTGKPALVCRMVVVAVGSTATTPLTVVNIDAAASADVASALPRIHALANAAFAASDSKYAAAGYSSQLILGAWNLQDSGAGTQFFPVFKSKFATAFAAQFSGSTTHPAGFVASDWAFPDSNTVAPTDIMTELTASGVAFAPASRLASRTIPLSALDLSYAKKRGGGDYILPRGSPPLTASRMPCVLVSDSSPVYVMKDEALYVSIGAGADGAL